MTEISRAERDAVALQDAAPIPADAVPASSHLRMKIDCTLAYELGGECEFVLLLHAAVGASPQGQPVVEFPLGDASASVGQALVEETLWVEPGVPYRTYSDPRSGNRFLRLRAQAGPLQVHYSAVVDRFIELPDLQASEVPVQRSRPGPLRRR